MSKREKILCIVVVLIVFLGFVRIIYEIFDFYNDYKCSTTTDTKWYIDNNCMRYEKGDSNV